MNTDKIFRIYAELIRDKPEAVFTVSVLTTMVIVAGAFQIGTDEQEVSDFLPEGFEAIDAFDVLEAEFTSAEATTYTILIETQPQHNQSNEIRDIREPEALNYIELITQEAENFNKVTNVDSPSNLFQETPPTKREVQNELETLGESRWSQTINEEYNAARITIQAAGITQTEGEELAQDLQYHIDSIPRTPGLELTYTGQIFIDQAFQEQSGETSQTTTTVAFALVLLVVILLFRSIYYGLTALQALLFGVAAGVGVFGWLGFNLAPATSGAISVGIGIAVDFGIQPVSRYLEERNKEELSMEESLFKTLEGTVGPMSMGMIAAVLGFSTLAIGDVTFLSDLGIILSLTTFMAFISAITVIPSSLILHDKYVTPLTRRIKKIL